jgi:uncharacterized repeat protein (TIGR03803 family)
VCLLLAGGAWAATKTIYNFTGGSDGGNPVDAGRLLRKGTDLYGTTSRGGQYGCGTVFELSGTSLTTLYAFGCAGDGANPSGSLIVDSSGNLYGTTSNGGDGGCGTVFELANTTLTTLYSFGCGDDGGYPVAGVAHDGMGNLYGTAPSYGLNGGGVAFEIAASGAFSVIYNFCSLSACADGEYPDAGLAIDAQQNLYGTTYQGGIKGCYQKAGCGTVFELSPEAGGVWKETVLHAFTGEGATDGAYPELGALTLSTQQMGNSEEAVIFGVTSQGGENGDGTVFEMVQEKKGYVFSVVHSFAGAPGDGEWPLGTLIHENGTLYGTTLAGGSSRDYGTIFDLSMDKGKKTWTETVLYSFTNGDDGGYPESGLVAGSQGNLYGVASEGGNSGYGVVYTLALKQPGVRR